MDDNAIEEMFHSTLTLSQAAQICGKRTGYVKGIWITAFGEDAFAERKRANYRTSKLGDKNPMLGKTGDKHHLFKADGALSDQGGYSRIRAPEWYSAPDRYGYAREHIVLYCEHAGWTQLPEGMEIHHLDQDKKNNKLSNLICLSASDHTKLHHWLSKT